MHHWKLMYERMFWKIIYEANHKRLKGLGDFNKKNNWMIEVASLLKVFPLYLSRKMDEEEE